MSSPSYTSEGQIGHYDQKPSETAGYYIDRVFGMRNAGRSIGNPKEWLRLQEPRVYQVREFYRERPMAKIGAKTTFDIPHHLAQHGMQLLDSDQMRPCDFVAWFVTAVSAQNCESKLFSEQSPSLSQADLEEKLRSAIASAKALKGKPDCDIMGIPEFVHEAAFAWRVPIVIFTHTGEHRIFYPKDSQHPAVFFAAIRTEVNAFGQARWVLSSIVPKRSESIRVLDTNQLMTPFDITDVNLRRDLIAQLFNKGTSEKIAVSWKSVKELLVMAADQRNLWTISQKREKAIATFHLFTRALSTGRIVTLLFDASSPEVVACGEGDNIIYSSISLAHFAGWKVTFATLDQNLKIEVSSHDLVPLDSNVISVQQCNPSVSNNTERNNNNREDDFYRPRNKRQASPQYSVGPSPTSARIATSNNNNVMGNVSRPVQVPPRMPGNSAPRISSSTPRRYENRSSYPPSRSDNRYNGYNDGRYHSNGSYHGPRSYSSPRRSENARNVYRDEYKENYPPQQRPYESAPNNNINSRKRSIAEVSSSSSEESAYKKSRRF